MNCYFCSHALGPNPILADHPFGPRVAFDPAHQRIWAVCRKCGRWSMANVDDEHRSAIVDRLERFYLATPSHTEARGIGVAQLPNGASLIRIGDVTWRSFAAWRYGMRLTRRHKTWLLYTILGLAFLTWMYSPWGDAVLDTWPGLLTMSALMYGGGAWLHFHGVARLPRVPGAGIVRVKDLGHAELEITDRGWRLLLAHKDGVAALEGHDAIAMLGRIMPWIYMGGGKPGLIDQSISLIERAGGPQRFFETRLNKDWIPVGRHQVGRLPPVLLNAIEMAANEATERSAVGGNLTMLDLHSTHASETAAIAEAIE